MNSFSHYAFGAVCEWMFRFSVGIDTETALSKILLRPGPRLPQQSEQAPIDSLKAEYIVLEAELRWRGNGNRAVFL